MFFDWLRIYQDHTSQLPVISDRLFLVVDSHSGDYLHTRQSAFRHGGSFSTSITIRINGNRVIMEGNPSRFGRPENLFGFSTLDECIEVYNKILTSYGLPPFTKGKKIEFLTGEDGKKASRTTDGAVIQELHVTTNIAVGENNADDFIKAISTLPYRQMVPRLHTNGKTADWLTKSCKGSDLIYPSVYNKAFEIELNALKKARRKFGDTSREVKYLQKVIDYCRENGVIRFEQKLKSRFLQQNSMQFFGLDNFSKLKELHDDFLSLPDKMQVEAMDFMNISQQLISAGVCDNTRSANTTAMYAINWMHGEKFDFNKCQVKTHRARLRKIGIDIALPCDLTKFSLVVATRARVVTMNDLPIPAWYQQPTVAGVSAA